ncbi:MAG: hypothetical protein ACO3EQ_00310 [Ilumatobacteraceae bacterium]
MRRELRTRFIALIAAVASVAILAPYPGQANAAVTVPTQPYVMAFHTCANGATDCNNPANHIVQLAQSADGVSWSLVSGWQSYRGSVPDAFRRGNTLYVFSTSGLLKVNMTTGETSTTSVSLNEGSFVDPSIAQLPDGRLILFYLPGIMGQDPAGCAPGEASCVRQIRSAVEVAGSDGSRFVVDSTPRVSETITSGSFSDPDIFFNGSEWVLYVSRGPSVHAYTSSSIQGSFAFRAVVSNSLGGVPSGLQMADGTIATYVHSNVGGGTEIRRATSSTGASSIASFQTSLTAQSLGLGTHAESPGIAANTPGISCATCVTTAATTTTSPTATAPVGKSSNVGLGKKCTVAGATAKFGKTNLVCKKVGKRLVWAKR